MTPIPTDLALAQTPTENASETPRLRETQTPDTATEGVCCQQRNCSALGFAEDVGSGRLGDGSWLKSVAQASRSMGVYEFFDWYQEFRKKLYAKRSSYLETH